MINTNIVEKLKQIAKTKENYGLKQIDCEFCSQQRDNRFIKGKRALNRLFDMIK